MYPRRWAVVDALPPSTRAREAPALAPLRSPRLVRWLRRLVVLGLLVALGFVLRRTLLAPDPVAVRVAPVRRGTVTATVTNSKAGTVRSRRRAKLSPEASGMVVELPFREGAAVRAGDLLLRLDDSTQRTELLLAERALEVARAEHERACLEEAHAARELERHRELAAQKVISQDLLEQYQNARDVARLACEAGEAQVRRAEVGVELAKVALAKTRLVAPFAGVVAELATEVGEWVTPAPPLVPVPPAVDLLDPSALYVSAPMDEVDSARIRTGQEVWITFDPHPGRRLRGQVSRIAPYVLDVEAQNRTVEIEVDLPPAEEDFLVLPGTSADVEVVLEERAQVLWIPTLSLLQDERVLVFQDGELLAREVVVGLRNWDRTEVREGLAEGERVVTSLERAEVRAGAGAVLEAEPGS